MERVLTVFFRFLLGGVLLSAGVLKVRLPVEELAYIIEVYDFLPTAVLFPLAHVLPWGEIALGLFLILGLYTPLVAAFSAVTFGVFILLLSATLWRGIDLSSCGCFGGGLGKSVTPSMTLVLDSVLFFASLYLLRHPRTALSLDAFFSGKNKSSHDATASL